MERRIELPALSRRATVTPATANADDRTVDVVFSTGAPVVRSEWWTGKRYVEKLSLKPEHIRLDRLNAGAPLLNTHAGYSLEDQIGVVVAGSARVEGKKAIATVRFSSRDQVKPIVADVLEGIIRNVSVGYIVHKFEEDASADAKLPVRTAIDWEPYEISLVPMPADTQAQTRSRPAGDTYPCDIVTRGTEESQTMQDDLTPPQPEFIRETPPAPARLTAAEDPPAEPNERDLGADAERARIQGIIRAVRAARLPMSVAEKLMADKTPLVDAQARVFELMSTREPDVPRGGAVAVQLGDDPFVHARKGIENALLHRLAPSHFKLEEIGRQYRGLSILDTARIYLSARGHRLTDMSKMELAGAALGLTALRAGMHSTSDFPLLLADVANKSLRRAYDEQPQTFAPLGTRVTIPDFKTVKRTQFGDAPSLVEIDEHGEYTFGTIGEGRETYQLATYGRKFAITRKAMVNDDLDAFSRVPMMFGRKARILESNIVWQQITTNPLMGDSDNLFSTAHANLAAAGAVISVTSLGEARAALRVQTSLDGDYMNLSARYLVVPPSQETLADQFVTVVTPQSAGNVNPFQNRLSVIAEPRLETEPDAWYVTASPDQIEMLEFGYLEGEEGPMVESRIGFDVDGVEIKARLDFAAKVIDWRGFFKNWGNT